MLFVLFGRALDANPITSNGDLIPDPQCSLLNTEKFQRLYNQLQPTSKKAFCSHKSWPVLSQLQKRHSAAINLDQSMEWFDSIPTGQTRQRVIPMHLWPIHYTTNLGNAGFVTSIDAIVHDSGHNPQIAITVAAKSSHHQLWPTVALKKAANAIAPPLHLSEKSCQLSNQRNKPFLLSLTKRHLLCLCFFL